MNSSPSPTMTDPPPPLIRSVAHLRMSEKTAAQDYRDYLNGERRADCFNCVHQERVAMFLFELSEDFKYSSECSWLSMNLFERYVWNELSHGRAVALDRVEKVASVCFVIAAKFLERYHPSIANIADVIECEASELPQLELEVLGSLEWDVRSVTPHSGVDMFLSACRPLIPAGVALIPEAAEQARALVLALIDLSVFESSTREFTPLTMAAAACAVVLQKLYNFHAIPFLEGCQLEQLPGCVSVFSVIFADSVLHQEPEPPMPSKCRATSPDSIMSLIVPGQDTPEPPPIPAFSSKRKSVLPRALTLSGDAALRDGLDPNVPTPMTIEEETTASDCFKRIKTSSSLSWVSTIAIN